MPCQTVLRVSLISESTIKCLKILYLAINPVVEKSGVGECLKN